MISSGMNLFINAQGFGTMGMMTVCIGAVLNLFLDPLFIFCVETGSTGSSDRNGSQSDGRMYVGSVVSDWEKGAVPIAEKVYEAKRQKNDSFHPGVQGLSGFIMCVTNSLSQIACNATLARWGGDLVCRCDDDFKFCA